MQGAVAPAGRCPHSSATHSVEMVAPARSATCRPRPEATTPTIERPPLLIGVRATMPDPPSCQQSTKHSPRGPAADVAAFDRHAKEGIALETRFRDANRIAAGRGGVPARRRGPRNADHGE